jgi:hypothetical protein
VNSVRAVSADAVLGASASCCRAVLCGATAALNFDAATLRLHSGVDDPAGGDAARVEFSEVDDAGVDGGGPDPGGPDPGGADASEMPPPAVAAVESVTDGEDTATLDSTSPEPPPCPVVHATSVARATTAPRAVVSLLCRDNRRPPSKMSRCRPGRGEPGRHRLAIN